MKDYPEFYDDSLETEFITSLCEREEFRFPLLPAPTYLESCEVTSSTVGKIIAKHNLQKVNNKHTYYNVAYSDELGHHIYVRLWSP